MRVGVETRVKFVVPRLSHEEITVAVVTGRVVIDLVNEAKFLAALQRAVSAWGTTSPFGIEAWKDSSEDFNVGDLSHYQHDEHLKKCLAEQGIDDLVIECHASIDNNLGPWQYDTILMDDPTEDNS
jgi:hypothetical protein